jgi:carbon monoxide dehydrogenase subunit G
MQVSGTYRIEATPQKVWDALFDPDVMRRCIPGCEDVQRVSPTQFTAAVVFKVGPVKAKFAGKVSLSDLDAPRACRMTGEGSGGVAGFAKGIADLKLAPDGSATVLNYVADAQIGGKLAQLGSRVVEGTMRKLADEFFSKFADAVGGTGAMGGDEAAATVKTTTATPGRDGRWKMMAAAVVLAIAAIGLWLAA